MTRELFFPPLATVVRESGTSIPPQINELLKNSSKILLHSLDEENITLFLSFIQRNHVFFQEFFALMRRPWDFEAPMVERWLSYQHDVDPNDISNKDNYVAKASDDIEISKYFPSAVIILSNSVIRTYWHMIMKLGIIPKVLDQVDMWMDFMSVFGLQNREIVKNITLQWLLIQKNSEIIVGKRSLDFLGFWNNVSKRIKHGCLRLLEISGDIGEKTIQSDESVVIKYEKEIYDGLILMYDSSFLMRTAFEICPALIWTTINSGISIEHHDESNSSNASNNDTKASIFHWMVIFYEFGLEFIKKHFIREDRSTMNLLPYWIEQARQNILSVFNILIREVFMEVPLIVSNSKNSLSKILLNRYFSSLLKTKTVEKLEEEISSSPLYEYFTNFFEINPENRSTSSKKMRELFISTIQSLSGITRSFVDYRNTPQAEKSSTFGKFIAEYDFYYDFSNDLNELAKKNKNFESEISLLRDIINLFKSMFNHEIEKNEISNVISLQYTKLEKLKLSFPNHNENYIQFCLDYENGNYTSAFKMIELGNLPSELENIPKYKINNNLLSKEEYIPSPSTSDIGSPIAWDQINIFSGKLKAHIGKKKMESLAPLSDALQKQILESYEYDDAYDDTYDEVFQIPEKEIEEAEDDIVKPNSSQSGNQRNKSGNQPRNPFKNNQGKNQGIQQNPNSYNKNSIQTQKESKFDNRNQFNKPQQEKNTNNQISRNLRQSVEQQNQQEQQNTVIQSNPQNNQRNEDTHYSRDESNNQRGRGKSRGTFGKRASRNASKKFMTSLHGT